MTAKTRTAADYFEITGWDMLDNGWSNVTEKTFAEYTGKPEGYSGIRTGDIVTVVRTTYFNERGEVTHVSHLAHKGGVGLMVHDPADLAL